MRRTLSVFATILLATATAAWSQAGPGRPGGPRGLHGMGMQGGGFEQSLFPPELVLHNQIAIGLTDDQTAQIKKLLSETHARMTDLQVDLQRAAERVRGVLEPARVDEAAAIAAAEQTMAIESQLKKTHLTLLVRIKNILTEEQQTKLAALRPQRPQGQMGPGGPPQEQ